MKVVLYQGGWTKKIVWGFYWGRNAHSINLGVLKTAESGNFKTVNYIVIGRFLTVSNVVPKITTFFARITTKPSKIVRLLNS